MRKTLKLCAKSLGLLNKILAILELNVQISYYFKYAAFANSSYTSGRTCRRGFLIQAKVLPLIFLVILKFRVSFRVYSYTKT